MHFDEKRETILVTGGAGFIGSHFIKHLLKGRENYNVVNVDVLSYAADLGRLAGVEKDKRYRFIKADVRDRDALEAAFSGEIDAVVHFAAETHVDNSIETPVLFGDVNVRGTLNLLDVARKKGVKKYIQISTDEVYGEIKEGFFTEGSPLLPNSPYSASKVAADCFVRAYIRTYDFPAVIVRPCNNYGPWQFPEKFIPVAATRAFKGEEIPVYARGLNMREWLYVADCAKAVTLVLEKGEVGEIYNVGSGVEKRNIDIAEKVLDICGKPRDFISFVEDRPGHDFRYALDSSKVRELGWCPKTNFDEGLKKTVRWYGRSLKDEQDFCEEIKCI
ncbi:MAG: dTDP-glucose 4,6-dehydratase [Candidatus Omnitrophota bacterium]